MTRVQLACDRGGFSGKHHRREGRGVDGARDWQHWEMMAAPRDSARAWKEACAESSVRRGRERALVAAHFFWSCSHSGVFRH